MSIYPSIYLYPFRKKGTEIIGHHRGTRRCTTSYKSICFICQSIHLLTNQSICLSMHLFRKKADEELGIVVEPGQIGGVHLVTEVNVINPSARIQPGDEIVQVGLVGRCMY